MRNALAVASLALVLAGCQTIGGYYDRLFGSSGPSEKPAELQPITATADVRVDWRADVGRAGKFAFSPAVVGSAVYAANAAGEVTKLDLASGKVQWRTETGTPLSTGPGSDGRTVVVGSPRGRYLHRPTN